MFHTFFVQPCLPVSISSRSGIDLVSCELRVVVAAIFLHRYMSHGLFNPAYKGGFKIINQEGQPTAVTAAHATARAAVWKSTQDLLARY
jgi:hypothetical protein